MSVGRIFRTIAGGCLIAFAAILLPTIAVTTWFLPRIYSTSALVRVIYAPDALENVDPTVVDELTRTQGALVLSDAMLEEVVGKLRLCRKWGQERNFDGSPLDPRDAVHLVKRSTGVVYPRDTVGLIRVRAFSEDRNECRDIANVMAEAYVGYVQAEPKQSPVTDAVVVEPALTPMLPVKPDFTRIILIGIGICVAFTVMGIALIISGARTSRLPPVGGNS